MKKSLKASGFEFLLGKKLGEGCSRTVYELAHDVTKVIKVEKGLPESNINEHQLYWQCYDLNEWLCPAISISDCGHFLIMEKTTPLRKDELPKDLPWWMIDTKIENFGWLNGRVVLHDYGLFNFYDWIILAEKRRKNEAQASTQTDKPKTDLLSATGTGVQ